MRNEACAGRGGHGMGSAAPCEAFSMVPKLRPSLYVRGVHASPVSAGQRVVMPPMHSSVGFCAAPSHVR